MQKVETTKAGYVFHSFGINRVDLKYFYCFFYASICCFVMVLNSCGGSTKVVFPYLHPVEKNDLNKIFDGDTLFYAWKTYKREFDLSEEVGGEEPEYIRTFYTLRYSDIDGMDPFQVEELEKEFSVRYNYLFFIDDRRCIYYSQDEDFTKKTQNRNKNKLFGKLILNLDEDYDDIKEFSQGKTPSYLPGEYVIVDDTIYFDFKSKKDIYIKALREEESILFKEIKYETSELKLISSPSNYISFDTLFFKEAQPVFERINMDYHRIGGNAAIPFQTFNLFFGFSAIDRKCKDLNRLHEEMERLFYCDYPSATPISYRITDIEYIDLNDSFYRKYVYQVFFKDDNGLNESCDYIIKEDLNNVKTW